MLLRWTHPEGPSGQRLSGALGRPRPRPPLPSPLRPRPRPGTGLCSSWVPLCPCRPFLARVPCPSPMPSKPPSRRGEAGSPRAQRSRPLPPFLPGRSRLAPSVASLGPCLAGPFWNLPGCSLTLSSGLLWPCPKAVRQVTLGPP